MLLSSIEWENWLGNGKANYFYLFFRGLIDCRREFLRHPVRFAGPTPVPSDGATGPAGQVDSYLADLAAVELSFLHFIGNNKNTKAEFLTSDLNQLTKR